MTGGTAIAGERKRGDIITLPPEIDPTTAARLIAERPDTQLVDVRQGWELEICAIQSAIHIPMSEIPARAAELDPERPLFVICHHGGRSMNVTRWLRANGFPLAVNVAGGIHQWATDIDGSLAHY